MEHRNFLVLQYLDLDYWLISLADIIWIVALFLKSDMVQAYLHRTIFQPMILIVNHAQKSRLELSSTKKGPIHGLTRVYLRLAYSYPYSACKGYVYVQYLTSINKQLWSRVQKQTKLCTLQYECMCVFLFFLFFFTLFLAVGRNIFRRK